jgi:oxygen-independent coproporphyrinogen-3 oxidase
VNDASGQTAGIYLHLPFCENLCPYCDFFSLVGDDDLIRDFTSLLIAEINLADGPFTEYTYDSIYFGGGTPSMLESNLIESIFSTLSFRFNLSGDTEITIECNPSTLTEDKLRGYRSAGVNRLSLGVQSFDDGLLKSLGRLHDSRMGKETFNKARRAGFDNVNIDLIYGVPGQTVDIWERDIHDAIELAPEHISAYNLTIEPETEFGRLYSQGKLIPPGEDEQRKMYYLLVDMLPDRELDRYEISNFARVGRQCRHNMKYWSNKPYLGLGPSAVSYDGEKRAKNSADYEKYRIAVSGGKSPAESVELIGMDKVIEERIMMGLRLAEGLSITDLSRECHYDILKYKTGDIDLLKENGYIEIADNRIRITRAGLFLADEIMIKLL